jgi:hypothetical protein
MNEDQKVKMSLSNQDRVASYSKVNANWQLHCGNDDRIVGTIYLGNNYAKANDYYGGYQGNYLKRIAALFPDKTSVAHLYAGQADVSELPGQKYDINPQSPDTLYADAREMSKYAVDKHDLWVCDPPYGEERLREYQQRYGCPADTLNIKRVFNELYLASAPGAHIVWLDWQRPFYKNAEWLEEGAVLYRGSTGHKDRSISIYRRAD